MTAKTRILCEVGFTTYELVEQTMADKDPCAGCAGYMITKINSEMCSRLGPQCIDHPWHVWQALPEEQP